MTTGKIYVSKHTMTPAHLPRSLYALRPEADPDLKPGRSWLWLAPGVGLGLFVLVVVSLLWILHQHEVEVQRNNLMRDIQRVEVDLSRELIADQEFMDQLARAFALNTESEASLREHAEDYLRRRPAITSIAWNAPNGTMNWASPARRLQAEIVSERPSTEEIERMLRLTAAMNRSTYTHAYHDYQGRSYIEYHSPVIREERFLGTMSATYSLSGLVQHLVPRDFSDKYRVVFVGNEGQLLSGIDSKTVADDFLTQSVAMTLPWRDLKLRATSYRTDSLVTQRMLGAITALLSVIIVWSMWSLRRHIDKRVKADEALKASHERFVTVLDALDAGVYVASMEENELLFVNDMCRQFFPGGNVGGDVAELERVFDTAPSTHFQKEDLLDARGEAGGALTGVLKAELQNLATGRWYMVRAKAIRWVDGRTVRMHMASDITDRKHAEEVSRQQHEKLLQTARLLTVGEMASALAHEINQPLAAIANYNRGCLQRLRSGNWDAAELADALEKASIQAERAGGVVRRVREFLRNREPTRTPNDVNAIIQDVARLVEVEAEKANVIITLLLADDLPQVLADRILVEQVILNLVKNAIESMEASATAQRTLTISSDLNGAYTTEIAVADQGQGIDQDLEAQLFSPFYTTKPDGMGIGLNICRSIIELHDGQLWFTRNPRCGSTFRFTLPTAHQ